MVLYGNMGVKRSVGASGMQTNAIKQLLNMFNRLKFQNSDFRDFPLYFITFPLYNVRALSTAPLQHSLIYFISSHSDIPRDLHESQEI